MRAKTVLAAVTVVLSAGAATSFAQYEPRATAPEGIKTASIGDVLVFVNASGMTLYTYDKDETVGKSSCNDKCAMAWPPVMAKPDAKAIGSWSVISRDDGTKQWAYRDKPVYTYSKDAAPGDDKGDDLGPNGTHVWHVIKA
jgi:predicted lipoprotein with Yx(FWY)xxD motif